MIARASSSPRTTQKLFSSFRPPAAGLVFLILLGHFSPQNQILAERRTPKNPKSKRSPPICTSKHQQFFHHFAYSLIHFNTLQMWLAQSDTDCAALWLVLKLLTGGDKHILFISSFIGFTCLSSFAMSSQILNHKYPCGTTWRRGYMCRVNQTTPPDRTPEVFRFLLRCFAGCGSLSSLIYRIGCGISSTTFCFFYFGALYEVITIIWNQRSVPSLVRS